jgi:hypothetical protein
MNAELATPDASAIYEPMVSSNATTQSTTTPSTTQSNLEGNTMGDTITQTQSNQQNNERANTTSKKFIVAYQDADCPDSQPEIYLCTATKAGRIRELLEVVSRRVEPNFLFPIGAITTLPNMGLVQEAKTVTLTELRTRFKEELRWLRRKGMLAAIRD